MNKRNLQNEKLDEIGRELLEAARIRDEEIERMISAPQLFNSVKAKIRTEKPAPKAGRMFVFPVWSRSRIGLAFGVLAILLVSVTGLIGVVTRRPSLTAGVTASDVSLPAAPRKSPEFYQPNEVQSPHRDVAQRTNFKEKSLALRKSAAKTDLAKRSRPAAREEEEAFYPLTFTGDPEDAKNDAQIIRVELPRSSLIALGVTPPTENQAENIKTELLIGSDGVTRGIRFVK